LLRLLVYSKDRNWPEPFIRAAEICTNPMATYWF